MPFKIWNEVSSRQTSEFSRGLWFGLYLGACATAFGIAGLLMAANILTLVYR